MASAENVRQQLERMLKRMEARTTWVDGMDGMDG